MTKKMRKNLEIVNKNDKNHSNVHNILNLNDSVERKKFKKSF